MSLANEGSIVFTAKGPCAGWATDEHGYNFPDFAHGGISMSMTKNPDGKLDIVVRGIHGHRHAGRVPVPEDVTDDLAVGVTWNKDDVKLYLAGQFVTDL